MSHVSRRSMSEPPTVTELPPPRRAPVRPHAHPLVPYMHRCTPLAAVHILPPAVSSPRRPQTAPHCTTPTPLHTTLFYPTHFAADRSRSHGHSERSGEASGVRAGVGAGRRGLGEGIGSADQRTRVHREPCTRHYPRGEKEEGGLSRCSAGLRRVVYRTTRAD